MNRLFRDPFRLAAVLRLLLCQ
ncbi:MAG: hypothetical protein V7606_3266, partial [Burkholderiales bacterium]